uniref:Uncharacterized protein n=1 Tax=Arundo donax TaxID=35708 RepID=A0A0A9H4Y7_ARUDO
MAPRILSNYIEQSANHCCLIETRKHSFQHISKSTSYIPK